MVRNNLKKILEEKGLKNKFVAEKIGIEPSYFCLLVKGKHIPSIEIVLKLEKLLNVSIHKMFYLDE